MIAALIRLLAVALLTMSLSFQASSEVVDAIVATVDTEVILRSEIVSEIRPLVVDKAEHEIVKYFNEALEQSIEQKILYREGVLNDIKITDEQVEARIEGFRERYSSEEDFLAALAEEGVTISAFRERIRKQTVALSMGISKRRYLERGAVISEAELAQYYQDNVDQFQKPERVKLYRIFIVMDSSEGGRNKTLARLETLREELALGAEFSKLAKQHSDGPSAADGGFVGWIGRGDFVTDLEEVAFGLVPGDVSPIVETDTGMMLFMAAEKVEAGLASFDEVRTEIEPVLRANYGSERYNRWMAELRKRSRVRKYQ
jgi:parvulin-like peptidyl-prolyl isomerase